MAGRAPRRISFAAALKSPKSLPAAPIRKAPLARVPTESVASESARRLAIDIATAALDKKALGLEVIDVAGRVDYTDFIVLMSGRSDRQVAALAEGIEEALRPRARRPLNVEGQQSARWILMDFGDVIVHIFQEEVRSMYDLEGLWEDARRLPVEA
jgi:ribosome-associated protein